MNGRLKLVTATAVVAGLAVAGTAAVAGGGKEIREHLTGYEEDPLTRSTTGNGTFQARIHRSESELSYRLSYADMEGSVTQAHIHFGGRHQSGGIVVFLCSNLGNGPAGTPACPASPGAVTGTLDASDVVGPSDQGIATGEFAELVGAIRAGVTYANVHTDKYPGGEIRAQLSRRWR
jgi:hypothetical protein